MKKFKILLIVFAFATLIAGLCACNCNGSDSDGASISYTVKADTGKSLTLTVGDTVDFTQYFMVTDPDGNAVPVTNDMLDLTYADTTKAGGFMVYLNYKGSSGALWFTVVAEGGANQGSQGGTASDSVDLSSVFNQYADVANWNYAVTFTDSEGNEDYYEYSGNNLLNRFTYDGVTYTEYYIHGTAVTYYYYMDDGSGNYTKYDEDSDEFEQYYYTSLIFTSELGNFTFEQSDGCYIATDASGAGNAVIGEYEDCTWTKLAVYITDGKLTKIEGTMSDGYVMSFTLSKHGQINFTLPNASEGGNGGTTIEPTGNMMESQTYDANTFDSENLQDKMLAASASEDEEGAIGLPSTGNYNVLVVPVQFKGDTITQAQLAKLEKAFNGTSADTGWESVKTYYQKTSYGKLNLSFDIHSVCSLTNNSTYYEGLTETDEESGQTYKNGDNVILHEVLKKLDGSIDFTKYDTNNDGCIDAVYLIYSADVDYDSNDSFYWAYVTGDSTDNQYDGLYAYYYLFAGFDFMDEGDDNGSMTINTETYIHETGHLFGLDDYYDYDETIGSNQSLGGCAMMDFNVGDHDAYSKIMLGWADATIVTSTQTVTIKSLQEKGDIILIPLDFNNSYFCEYLLIDLYSASGLNELRSEHGTVTLYGGADFGVRIYHVSSSASNPYNDDYGSFTDYNNSSTDIPLIRLVEADGGDSKFIDADGNAIVANADDLWQAGDTLSGAFENYIRNNGDSVNFDITINSVSATEANITITFKN